MHRIPDAHRLERLITLPNRAVGIVGCGTAGQASAILLARAGWKVTILERAPVLDSIGAGLLIQPSGAAVLRQLGVLDQVDALASRVDRLFGTSKQGKAVMDIRYGDLAPGLHGLGVHRGMLFRTLQNAVSKEDVTVRTGFDVQRIERNHAQCTAIDHDGGRHGPFDLLLVCDGASSAIRAQSDLIKRDQPYKWAAFWFIGRADPSAADPTLRQVFGDTRQLLGLLPTGRLDASGEKLTSLFWSIRSDTIEQTIRDGITTFRETVHTLTPLADTLLAQIDSMDQLIVARYRDVVMHSTVDPPIAFLGDAAHAMSPQLGQGANLALLDASALAASMTPDTDIATCLVRFARCRMDQTRFYQRASRHLMPAFQSDLRWLAVPRDMMMPYLCRWNWTQGQAVQTLAGTKTGICTANPLPQYTDP